MLKSLEERRDCSRGQQVLSQQQLWLHPQFYPLLIAAGSWAQGDQVLSSLASPSLEFCQHLPPQSYTAGAEVRERRGKHDSLKSASTGRVVFVLHDFSVA